MIIFFGGSFDPIHIGHIKIVNFILKKIRPTKLLVIPTGTHPFKKEFLFSDIQRLNFCKIALSNYPKAIIDDMEITSNQMSYTINTIAYLKKKYPYQKITMVIGLDAFNNLNFWFKWQQIIKNTNFIVINRAKNRIFKTHTLKVVQNMFVIKNKSCGNVFFLKKFKKNVASSDIKTAILNNKKIYKQISNNLNYHLQKCLINK